MTQGATFWLCLTHDVDRPYKTYQSLYYAIRDRDPYHLRTLAPDANPYWRFDDVMAIEEDLGVKSAFYFLNEQSLLRDRPPSDWLDPTCWKLYAGRYSITDPDIVEVIRTLDRDGWEVGLHGSFESYRDRDRLGVEKSTLEAVLGHDVRGGRQHYLNLEVPETWAHQSAVGLKYDTTLGSSTEFGFPHGHGIKRPFDDDFVVFPLTLMENALPDPGDRFDTAWAACQALLDEAVEHRAVMTVLWHPNKFSERDYPGYRTIYYRLVESAIDRGAWVGPPGELYETLPAPGSVAVERERPGVLTPEVG